MWLPGSLLVLAGSAVLYHVSAQFRYITRYLFMYGVAIVAGACCVPQGLLYRPCDLRNGARFVWPLRLVSWTLGLRWRIEGLEHLRQLKDSGAVIVSNHQNAVDVLGMVELWPEAGLLASVIKREVWFGLPFALAAWLCGQIFINRSNPASAKATLNRVAERLGPERIKLWVFPEGTRGDGVKLLPFKKGAFHIAVAARVPVLPVVFSSYRSYIDSRQWKWLPGRPTIRILAPVDVCSAGSSSEHVLQLAGSTRQLMEDAFNELNRAQDDS